MVTIPFLIVPSSSYIADFPTIFENPEPVEITFSEEVDTNQSEFWYENTQIYSENDKIILYVNQENNSIFSYVLKNSQGDILDEGSQTIYLDSKAPDIRISDEYGTIDSDVYLKDESNLQINIEDENLQECKIFVDDTLVSSHSQETILVNKTNKEIKIQAQDAYNHVSEKIIHIHSLEDITGSCTIGYDAYTVENTVNFVFDKTIDNPLDLIVYVDSVEKTRLDIQGKDLIELNLDTTGDISFQVACRENKNLPIQLLGYDLYQFHFSNEKPFIKLYADTTYSNQDICIYALWDSRYLQSSYLEIWNGTQWIQSDLTDSFLLKAKDNQEIQYIAKATIVDKFNQSASSEIVCMTDLKGPFFQLFINNQLMNTNEIIEVEKSDLFTYKSEKSSNLQTQIYKDGNLLEGISLESAIENLKQDEVLDVRYILRDSLMNTSEYQYFMKLKKQYLPQSFTTEYIVLSNTDWNTDFKEVINEWEVNKDNKLVRKKKTIKIEDKTKPKIEWIEEKNKIRIILMKDSTSTNEFFQSIVVDDKQIDLKNLKQDSLGNPYYEFTYRKKCDVKVIAKDEAGNTTELHKNFTQDSIDYVPAFIFFLVCGLIVYIFKQFKS